MDELLDAIDAYSDAHKACEQCTELLLSSPPKSNEAADLMVNLERTRGRMFLLASNLRA